MFEYLIGAIVVFVAIKIYFIIQDEKYQAKNKIGVLYRIRPQYICGYDNELGGRYITLEICLDRLILKFDDNIKQIFYTDLKNYRIMTESQIQKDISAGRILALGVFALATNKTKTITNNYLVLEFNDNDQEKSVILDCQSDGKLKETFSWMQCALKKE